ncbi:MAG: hypothetical protein K9L26_03915 [Candidatus Izimaplasma sp.]|nr:hypothetical protein [Candidatus Izimaplasma bacterium]
MAFDAIRKSQARVVQLLENSVKKGRLSHAYLFEGAIGAKQYETALYFAQMLLCQSDDKPCLTCHNCKRILHLTHPNVYVVEPIKTSIRKQQIVDLQIEFSKTSIEPGKKIYIIKDIDKIQVGAANSLLKFLEEPHDNIVGILTTTNRNAILPTIISRSQIVSFASLSSTVVEQDLIDVGYEKYKARILSHLTSSVNEAEEIASIDGFEEIIDFVPDMYDAILDETKSALMVFHDQGDFIVFDNVLSKLFMQCMILLQKDILHYFDGDMTHLVYEQHLDLISNLSQQKPKNRRIEELEHMLDVSSRLDRYINQRLAYDNLLYELERSE